MADNILKLRVESSEYDQKLKKAAEGIRHLAEVAHRGGGELTGLEKAELDYVKALGSMETKSRTASGSVRELESTFKELTVVYNHLNDVEKQDEGGKALRASLDQIKQRAQEAKKELAEVTAELDGTSSGGKGGFLSGLGDKTSGMLQVFGGNLLAEGVSKLTSELAGSVQESIELARQGEGIRMAFERLNKPGLLDNLKEATHGTVSEIELMQQAIKFENFKLPVEDLANYLAFAQQKAKDTGESIDYLVNSIVTGLGRQSKQILDNIGISAAELTSRMNEGATMTQAVSDIIREEMAKAGDYVETAADRAARAAADTKNKMEELGRSAMPVAEEFASAWNEIRNGAMTLVLPVLKKLADSIRDIREILNGERDMPKLKPGIKNLAEGSNIDDNGNFIRKPSNGNWAGFNAQTGQYNNAITAIQDVVVTGKKRTGGSGGRSGRGTNAPTYQPGSLAEALADVQKYTKLWQDAGDAVRDSFLPQVIAAEERARKMKEDMAWAKDLAMGKYSGQGDFTKGLSGARSVRFNTTLDDMVRDGKDVAKSGSMLLSDKAMAVVTKQIKEATKPQKKEEKSAVEVFGQMNQGINQIVGGIEGLGITIPEELSGILGGINSMLSVLQGIIILVQGIAAMQEIGTFLGIFHNGGIVGRAASGMLVGTHMSGDNLRMPVFGGGMIGINDGELILNRAQQGNLASQLNGGLDNLNLTAIIRGEQIRLAVNNNGKRTGRGEMVQTNRR